MLPVKLTIEGIYSYQKSQTIDFEELTSAGLFGIFGNTGSGKSSILEAISYALYGKIERLNQGDKLTYNMMNLKSDRIYVDFTFRNYESKLYRVTREVKRNKTHFDKIYSPTTVFYEWQNDTWIPVELDAEKIIGLSYENFKRTVIIPQGQFKEFIELGAADRTRMMEEIFQLKRFNLFENVRKLRTENNSKLDELKGILSTYENTSAEQLKAFQDELQTAQAKEKEETNSFEKINLQYQALQNLKSDYDDFYAKSEKLKQLEIQKQSIEAEKQKVDLFEKMNQAFSQILKEQTKSQNDLVKQQQAEKEVQQKLVSNQENLTAIQTKLQAIQVYHEQLQQYREKEKDLQHIVDSKNIEAQLVGNQERLLKGKLEVEKLESGLQVLMDKRNHLRQKHEELQAEKMDSKLLSDVQQWFSKQETNQQAIQNSQIHCKKLELELEAILKELNPTWTIGVEVDSEVQQKVLLLEERKQALELEKNKYEVQQKLSEHAHELHDGEACPLCGSIEHPDVLESADFSQMISELAVKISECNQEIKQLYVWNENAKNKSEQLSQAEAELKQQTEVLNQHLISFSWEEFSPDRYQEFQEKKNKSFETENLLNQNSKERTALEESIEVDQKKIKKYQDALAQIKEDVTILQTTLKSKISSLVHIQLEDYKGQTQEKVLLELSTLTEKNNLVEKQHQEYSEKLNELKLEQATLQAKAEQIDIHISQIKSQLDVLLTEIQDKLEKHQVDLDKVQEILAWSMDVEAIRNKIQNFHIEYQTLQNAVNELQLKLEGQEYSEEKMQEVTTLYHQAKESLEALKARVAELNFKCQEEKQKLEKKLKLQKENEALEKRGSNLDQLNNLFRSSGFVEYVSSIYLRQLCDIANVRFTRMTRNQLSLNLSESNDFVVVDHLNEGKVRSAKTLSGGQQFQVSLSLALALAESVQSHIQSDKNFFFIDEGFGTQDSHAVQVVFETLLSLNKENKIVGIISHVEELKENIPMSLTIQNDSELGSIIYSSSHS